MQTTKALARSRTWLAVVVLLFAGTTAFASQGTQAFDQDMQPIVASYLKIQERLAADSTDGVAAEAQAIAGEASALDAGQVSGEHAAHYESLPVNLKNAALALSSATDIQSSREAFKGLSRPMAMWATMSQPEGIDVVFCSMAGASWLQREGDVRNPYYGASMLSCGEVMGRAGQSGDSMNAQHGQAEHQGHHMGSGGGHRHMMH